MFIFYRTWYVFLINFLMYRNTYILYVNLYLINLDFRGSKCDGFFSKFKKQYNFPRVWTGIGDPGVSRCHYMFFHFFVVWNEILAFFRKYLKNIKRTHNKKYKYNFYEYKLTIINKNDKSSGKTYFYRYCYKVSLSNALQ